MRAVLLPLLVLGFALTPSLACQKKVRFSGDTAQKDDNTNNSNTKTDTSTSLPPSTTPQCKQVENLTGAHFFIAMDNSGSMLETDCQKSSNPSYSCNETARERALKAVADGLVQMAVSHPNRPQAVSTLSVGLFTVSQRGGALNLSRDVLYGPKNAVAGSQAEVANALTILRNPAGDTPYLNASGLFDYFSRQVNSSYGNDGKARVAILITDGEATDRNPKLVSQAFANLKNTGVKVFTLMLTNGSTRAARLPRHESIMQSSYPSNWWDRSYGSFANYFRDLVSLPEQISQKVVELPSAQNLTDAIFKEVIAKELKCE